MTTDERLDRLTEKHGALAESLQLLTADVQSLAQSEKTTESSGDTLNSLATLRGSPPHTNSASSDWKAGKGNRNRAKQRTRSSFCSGSFFSDSVHFGVRILSLSIQLKTPNHGKLSGRLTNACHND